MGNEETVADLAALIPNPGDSIMKDGYVWTMVGTWDYCDLCDDEHVEGQHHPESGR